MTTRKCSAGCGNSGVGACIGPYVPITVSTLSQKTLEMRDANFPHTMFPQLQPGCYLALAGSTKLLPTLLRGTSIHQGA